MIVRLPLAAALLAWLYGTALADTYPTRAVTMIVPFAAGGPVDNIGRTFADAMRRQLGQGVIIDNRPGGGGVAGTRAVIAAKPDGYTLLVGSAGPLIVAPAAGTDGVDVERQLTPVGLIAESPQILVAGQSLPATTLAELVAMAKAQPGALNYSSAGIGTMPHLAGELLKVHAGIDMLHVPYRGTGAALPDLLSGRNAVMFGDITSVLALLEAGRLKAFAITANQRSPLAPNVPTMPEAGLPGVLTKNWNALMGPIGLPQPIVVRLSDAIRQIAGDATYLGAMQKQGATPLKSSTAELTQHLKTERETLGPIIKAIGMKLE